MENSGDRSHWQKKNITTENDYRGIAIGSMAQAGKVPESASRAAAAGEVSPGHEQNPAKWLKELEKEIAQLRSPAAIPVLSLSKG